jgi:hypothetical protein
MRISCNCKIGSETAREILIMITFYAPTNSDKLSELDNVYWSHAMSLILKELMGCVYVQFNIATTRLYYRRKHRPEDSPTCKVEY